MTEIFNIRQRMKELYTRYDSFVVPVLKFIVMMLFLVLLKNCLGLDGLLSQANIMILIALVCALLPWGGITFVALACFLAGVWPVSMETAVVAVVLAFIFSILHYLFLPGFSIVIVLVPIAFFLHIPYAVPLIVGLVGGVTSFIPVGIGAFSWYFLSYLQKNLAAFAESAAQNDPVTNFSTLITGIFNNPPMLLTIAAFCLATAAVYGLRRLPIDFSHYVAVAVGTIVMIIAFLAGNLAFGITVSFAEVFIGSIIGFLIAVLIAFWIVVMDYSRTEYFDYEDDDYYYYVRAVPKISVTPRQLKIREIIPKAGEKKEKNPEDDEIEEALKVLDSETAAEAARERETERIQIHYQGGQEPEPAPEKSTRSLKSLFGRRKNRGEDSEGPEKTE